MEYKHEFLKVTTYPMLEPTKDCPVDYARPIMVVSLDIRALEKTNDEFGKRLLYALEHDDVQSAYIDDDLFGVIEALTGKTICGAYKDKQFWYPMLKQNCSIMVLCCG